VNDIKRDAEKIERHVSKMQNIDGDPKTRKTMKSAKYDQLDTVMYQWLIQARTQGIPLSGPVIMAKAVEMNKKLDGDPKFKASIGWLDKFKCRHGIRKLDISGEKLSANSTYAMDGGGLLVKVFLLSVYSINRHGPGPNPDG
jgi:ribosomal protein S10